MSIKRKLGNKNAYKYIYINVYMYAHKEYSKQAANVNT